MSHALAVSKKIGLWTAAGLVACASGFAQIVSTFPVVNGFSEPLDIVAGPDGAMWFTDLGDNQIGRIGPAGTISNYRLSTWSGGESRRDRTATSGSLKEASPGSLRSPWMGG